MKNNSLLTITLATICLLQISCASKWTKVISSGKITNASFNEKVSFSTKKALMLVPVTINGKEYHFLFDSGAPFSISEEVQQSCNFKIVSKSNIVDSDQNKKRVDWVQVDSLKIGNVVFENQSALVGDFKANPVLKCFKIDGIIGSNIIRNCNWTIDQDNNEITLSNTIDQSILENAVTLPFQTDHQFNMFIDLNIGKALVKHLLVDYGSNGSLGVNDKIFAELKEHNIINKIATESGVKQTGFIGKPTKFSRESTITDSIKLNNHSVKSVKLKTSKTTSVGNQLLSRFIVTIDWPNKRFYLNKSDKTPHDHKTFGFSVGYTKENGIYILSIEKDSEADKNGIKSDMKIVKANGLDFENGNDFCDYVDLKIGDTMDLELIDSEGKRKQYSLTKR